MRIGCLPRTASTACHWQPACALRRVCLLFIPLQRTKEALAQQLLASNGHPFLFSVACLLLIHPSRCLLAA
jgi:hypothetical protein